MKTENKIGELRWLVIKAMLDEFPELRKKAKKYIEKVEKEQVD